MSRGYFQGRFIPRFPNKYKGNSTNICYRSGWELRVMNFLDLSSYVLEWGSETVIVPYRKPADGNKIHRYYPDFIVTKLDKNGNKETIMLEVKPSKETAPPVRKSRVTKRYLHEALTYSTNDAKWKAAQIYCQKRGWKFQIITENDIK